MSPIIETIDVNRPAADVYSYATDPTRFSEWQQGVVSGQMEHGDPAGAHHCITVRRIGFTEQRTTSELVHADPPKRWSVRGVDGPIRARVDVTENPPPTAPHASPSPSASTATASASASASAGSSRHSWCSVKPSKNVFGIGRRVSNTPRR